jgi:hypothetical protein
MIFNQKSLFSLFVLEEIKWNVSSRMNEDESRSFLRKLAEKWTNLKQAEKEKFEKRFNESKKDLKKNIKEFLMVMIQTYSMY